jgi:hypothetical protein
MALRRMLKDPSCLRARVYPCRKWHKIKWVLAHEVNAKNGLRTSQHRRTPWQKFASQAGRDSTAWGKLVSEIGRDFSPGTIDPESKGVLTPRNMPFARFGWDSGPSRSPLSRWRRPDPDTGPWDFHGTCLVPRRDFRTSNPFRNGTLCNKSHKERVCRPQPPFAGTLPSHKSHALLYLSVTHYESSTYRRVNLLSEAIIQLTTPTPPGGGWGVSENPRRHSDPP